MSYTTRCPACGTTFRVVPDQLKISDGWVRCGHCADVFDATLYLERWVPPAPAPAAPSEAGQAASPDTEPMGLPASQDPVADEAAAAPAPFDAPAAALAMPDTDVAGEGAPQANRGDAQAWAAPVSDADAPQHQQALNGTSEPPADVPTAQVDPSASALQDPDGIDAFQAERARHAVAAEQLTAAPEPTEMPAPVMQAPPMAYREPEAVVAEHEAGEPGFVRQARRQAFWRSPAMRLLLSVAGVLLAALLLVQWALHERDRLAVRHPVLLPALTAFCETLGCTIEAPRDIGAVVIDSSNLVRRLGNFYAFDLVIKNTADLPMAVPALELSLTDTRDQVIARRVFLPAELPGAPALLPAQGSVSLSLRLSIAEVGPVSMAGYRALVFYP